MKKQWLNKYNIITEENINSISLVNDIIYNEKTIFLVQGKNIGNFFNYLYVFNFNDSGIFYDELNNIFNNNKMITFSPTKKY